MDLKKEEKSDKKVKSRDNKQSKTMPNFRMLTKPVAKQPKKFNLDSEEEKDYAFLRSTAFGETEFVEKMGLKIFLKGKKL